MISAKRREATISPGLGGSGPLGSTRSTGSSSAFVDQPASRLMTTSREPRLTAGSGPASGTLAENTRTSASRARTLEAGRPSSPGPMTRSSLMDTSASASLARRAITDDSPGPLAMPMNRGSGAGAGRRRPARPACPRAPSTPARLQAVVLLPSPCTELETSRGTHVGGSTPMKSRLPRSTRTASAMSLERVDEHLYDPGFARFASPAGLVDALQAPTDRAAPANLGFVAHPGVELFEQKGEPATQNEPDHYGDEQRAGLAGRERRRGHRRR